MALSAEDRDALAVGGFLIAVIALLWLFLRNLPGVGDTLRMWEGASFPDLDFTPPNLGASLSPSTAIGRPPSKLGGGACCGICDNQRQELPAINVAINWGPPPLQPAITQLLLPTFSPLVAPQSTTCPWNAAGYAESNPDVVAEYQNFSAGAGEWKKWRKKWGALSLDGYLREHYYAWGINENRTWTCG